MTITTINVQTGQVEILNEVAPSFPEPVRPVEKVTRTQFCLAAKGYALLSPADAIDAAKGGWPAAFTAALSSMPGIDVDDAQIVWAAATEIHRAHPIMEAMRAYLQWTPGQMDAFFTDASGL